jgi:release factor glutamine methyltransferase
VGQRVLFVQGRGNDPLRLRADGIVSNPPYIPSDKVNYLPRDVRHEPRASLDGGADGTRDLLQLLREGPDRLVAGGILALECGEEQVAVLQEEALAMTVFDAIQPVYDLAGRPRGLVLLCGNREKT